MDVENSNGTSPDDVQLYSDGTRKVQPSKFSGLSQGGWCSGRCGAFILGASLIINLVMFGVTGYLAEELRKSGQNAEIDVVKKFYDKMKFGCEKEDCTDLNSVLSDKYHAHTEKYGTMDRAEFEAAIYEFSQGPHVSSRNFIASGEYVVSWFRSISNGNSIAGTAVHKIKDGKILETHYYMYETLEVPRRKTVNNFYKAFAERDWEDLGNHVTNSWVVHMKQDTMNMPDFIDWLGTKNVTSPPERVLIEEGKWVVSFFHVTTTDGVISGTMVHEFEDNIVHRTENGVSLHMKIARSYMFENPPPEQMRSTKLFYAAIEQNDADFLNSLLTDDYYARTRDAEFNKGEFLQVAGDYSSAVHESHREYIEEDDTVVTHWALPGNVGDVTGCTVHKFQDGKLKYSHVYTIDPIEQLQMAKDFAIAMEAADIEAVDHLLATDWQVKFTSRGTFDFDRVKTFMEDRGPIDFETEHEYFMEHDTVVDHWTAKTGGGDWHGVTIHVFDGNKIAESRLYASEPAGELESVKLMSQVADGDVEPSDLAPYLADNFMFHTDEGEFTKAEFLEKIEDYAATPGKETNRTYIEQGQYVVDYYQEKDDNGEADGCMVNVFDDDGKIKESWLFHHNHDD